MKYANFIILNLSLIFIFSLHSNILYSQSSEAVTLYKAGLEAEQSEKYDEAIAYFSLAITLEPNYYDSYVQRGIVYRKIKNYYRAIRDYTKLLNLKNTCGNYLNRAKVYVEMNEPDKALSDLTKSIKLNNKSYDAYYTRAMVYYNKSEYDSSTADLLKCIEIYPDYKDAKEKLASILKDNGNPSELPIASSNQSKNKETLGVDRFKDGELHKEPIKDNASDTLIAKNKPVTENKEITNQPVTQDNKIDPPQVSENVVKQDNEIKQEIKQPVAEIKEELKNPDIQIVKNEPQVSENVTKEKQSDNVSNEPQVQNESKPIAENKKIENPIPEIKEELKEPVKIVKNEQPQISENVVQEKPGDNIPNIPVTQNESNMMPVAENKTENTPVENKEEISKPNLPIEKNEQPQISENVVQEKPGDNIPNIPVTQNESNMMPVAENKTENTPVENNNVQQNNNENVVPPVEKTEQQAPVKTEIGANLVQSNASQNENQVVITENKKEEVPKIENKESAPETPKSNGKVYAIQLAAFANEMNARAFTNKVKDAFEEDVTSSEISGLYKIRVGSYPLNEAIDIVKKIRESGYPDAFVVDLSK